MKIMTIYKNFLLLFFTIKSKVFLLFDFFINRIYKIINYDDLK